MGVKNRLRNLLSGAVRPFGYEVMEQSALYDWQKPTGDQSPSTSTDLPDGAFAYLVDNHPSLEALRARYAKFNAAVTAPLVWTDELVRGERLRFFRGDYAYVWQRQGRNMNLLGYALTMYYARSIDTLGLMEKLQDDDLFGNRPFQVDGRYVSRDLLDSLIEIYFLERHLKLSQLDRPTLLDIGAGYGRLAHRVVEGLPNVGQYLCTDGVAASTFVSEYYLRFRKASKASVIPLDEIEARLTSQKVDIAINIHSFSECQISAIDWWLALLARAGVRYLFIVPNTAGGSDGQQLLTNDLKDFMPLIERCGYRLVVREPKFRDPVVQTYGINPTYHHLFELR